MARASAFSFGVVYGSIKLKYLKVPLIKFAFDSCFVRLGLVLYLLLNLLLLFNFITIKFLSFIEFTHSWHFNFDNQTSNIYIFSFWHLTFGLILGFFYYFLIKISIKVLNVVVLIFEFKKLSILLYHSLQRNLHTAYNNKTLVPRLWG